MSMPVIQVLQAITVAMWVGAAIKLFQVWRAPEVLPLRMIAAGLVSLACAWTIAVRPGRFIADGFAGGLSLLLSHLGVMAMAYCVLMFFTYSIHGRDNPRRVGLVQFAVLAGAAAVGVAAWRWAPSGQRAQLLGESTSAHAEASVFVAAVIGYIGYALGMALRCCLRYAWLAQRVALRRGLRILAVGLAAFEIVCAAAVVKRGVLAFPGPAEPAVAAANVANTVALIIGAVCFIVGLSYPTVAGIFLAVPVWRRHRRDYRALTPLWRQMVHAFPDLVLGRTRRVPRPWGIHRRRYRRAIEIRDGLVQLGPYYPHDDVEVGANTDESERVRRHAERINSALRAKAAGQPPSEPPYAIPMIGGPDLDSDVRWLIELSRAMSSNTPMSSNTSRAESI
jgi:hypothetical protein